MAVFRTYNRKKVLVVMTGIFLAMILLVGRLVYVMIVCKTYYTQKADDVQTRERSIKAARGKILDRNGVVLAGNETVCTISVIYSQVDEPEAVIAMLVKELELSEETVRAKVEKRSLREKIKSNVDKETGDRIRAYGYAGVKVDEDYKRNYPYGTLASKVLGFAGADNQGIVGLEVFYDSLLKGQDGKILTVTDARGIELEGTREVRQEAVSGSNLCISLDYNIQMYAQQIAEKTLEAKEANYVSIIVMNPNNGEILAMVNAPEYDLNDPYTITGVDTTGLSEDELSDLRNQMWRNQSINDTYEPGSTFKIVTATAGLEEKVVTIDSTFSCPGYKIVEDRRIRCHKTAGHGSETFLQATMNSCNPVFMTVGERVGVSAFYDYMGRLGILEKTGIDLPGEAATIIHKQENVGPVELATMSFGQSFQITPMQLLRAASAVINGGTLVTPHFGISVQDTDGNTVETLSYETVSDVISLDTSKTMQYILEQVVAEGTGANGAVEGFRIGGKTATSQKLPRSANKYIASYIGFAPADDPQVIAIGIVDEPQGVYYGGSVAAPMIQELYENILPYLGIEQEATED
jgi:stage V sporulation protein D (sporulation-specific penicillin-binding protein)